MIAVVILGLVLGPLFGIGFGFYLNGKNPPVLLLAVELVLLAAIAAIYFLEGYIILGFTIVVFIIITLLKLLVKLLE